MIKNIDIVKEGIRVFDAEIEALTRVRECIGNDFVTIINEIASCSGKVIVTGVGKPGHVAVKMAATFSSLGTQAFFLHPAEAMHGDVGMIGENDLVIAISYSGESDELLGIIPAIKTIGAKLIALTGKGDSSLARAADFVQVFPDFEEACAMGLAPTSSTTVEMCYGDALAVVASELYGFSDSDFGKLHPAGALGKKLLLRVEDLMSKGDAVPIAYEGSLLTEAIEAMSEKRLGVVNVVDKDGKLIGIITDYDLRKIIRSKMDIYTTSVDETMNCSPIVYGADKMAIDAMMYMRGKGVSFLPIVDDRGKLVGALHMQQILRAGIVI